PLRPGRHDDERLVHVDRAFAGVAEQAEPVRLRRVGDPHLRAVDDVVAAVLARGRLERGDVGAAADLADRDRRDHVAGDRGRQELGAQLVGAPARQGRGRHVGLHADRHAERAAARGAELLDDHRLVRVVEAHAAELLGLVDAEQAERAHLLEDVVQRHEAGVLPRLGVRVDLLVEEVADRAAQLVVLFGQAHAPNLARRGAKVTSGDFGRPRYSYRLYFLIFSYSVDGAMPSTLAVRVRLPFSCSRV